MLAELAAGDPEPERERLRQDLLRPGEIQRQQQRLLLQRLEPVQPPRRHVELQTRSVTLTTAPGEPADRLASRHRVRPQVPDQRHLVPARNLPRGGPAPRPPRPQLQPCTLRLAGHVSQEHLIQPAAIRPHRQHVAHGHQTSAPRTERLRPVLVKWIDTCKRETPAATRQPQPPATTAGVPGIARRASHSSMSGGA